MTARRMVHKAITRAEMRRIKTEYFPAIHSRKQTPIFLGPGNGAAAAAVARMRNPSPLDACPALMFFSGFP
jgi:hypothetical protein